MEYKPTDFSYDLHTASGNWGMRTMYRVTVTHKPTGLQAHATSNTPFSAKNLAWNLLLRRLDGDTDYYKQMELF